MPDSTKSVNKPLPLAAPLTEIGNEEVRKTVLGPATIVGSNPTSAQMEKAREDGRKIIEDKVADSRAYVESDEAIPQRGDYVSFVYSKVDYPTAKLGNLQGTDVVCYGRVHSVEHEMVRGLDGIEFQGRATFVRVSVINNNMEAETVTIPYGKMSRLDVVDSNWSRPGTTPVPMSDK